MADASKIRAELKKQIAQIRKDRANGTYKPMPCVLASMPSPCTYLKPKQGR